MSGGDFLHQETLPGMSALVSQPWPNSNNSLFARLGVQTEPVVMPPREVERISIIDDDNTEIETKSNVSPGGEF